MKFQISNYINILKHDSLVSLIHIMETLKNVDIESYFTKFNNLNIINNKILKILNKTENPKYDKQIFNYVFEEDQILKEDNTFISSEILTQIQTKMRILYTITTSNINMRIIKSGSADLKNEEIEKILFVVSFMDKIIKSKEKYNIHIYLTDVKKKFDIDEKYLAPNEINGGSTIRGKIIILWRSEEYIKILIHELFHFGSIDFDDEYYLEQPIKVDNMISQTNINANETYTEIITLMTYNVYNAFLMNKNKKCNDMQGLINELYLFELIHSCIISSKILQFYNINDFGCLLKKDSMCSFNEYTNAFEYYILKAFILTDIDNFVNKILDNNIIKMYDNEVKIHQFFVYINNLINNYEFINKFIKNELKYPNTLRFVAIDLIT